MKGPTELRVPPRRETTAEVGRILDRRWHLNSVLGEGAMGRVFLAQQLSVHRPVAVKVIRPDLVTDSTAISRFLREARILSGLQHPHIVRLIDFGQETATGELYLVMELLAGRALGDRIEGAERFTLPEILTLVEQLAQALAEAHGRGVIHRDLKPGNLFVDRRDGVGLHLTVFDFGIAKIDEPLMPRLTRTGRINGTPHYIAPEQIRGQATPQTDMYAVGVLLYELLSGSVPHDGGTVMEVLMSHLERDPPSITDRWRVGPVEPAVVDLVDDLLQRDPQKRPRSAVDLYERVRSLRLALELGGDPVAPGTLSSWRVDLVGEDAPTDETAPLVALPGTIPMDAPGDAPLEVVGVPEAAVGLGATFDGWEGTQPQPNPTWKWVGIALVTVGALAAALVVGLRLGGAGDPSGSDAAQPPLSVGAPVVAVPADAPLEVGETSDAAAPVPAADDPVLAVEDAARTPPSPAVEPGPTPAAPAVRSGRRPRRRDEAAAGNQGARKKRDLGDVLKGMRSP